MATKSTRLASSLMQALSELEGVKQEGRRLAGLRQETKTVFQAAEHTVGDTVDAVKANLVHLNKSVASVETTLQELICGKYHSVDVQLAEAAGNEEGVEKELDRLQLLVTPEVCIGGDCITLRRGVYRTSLQIDGKLSIDPKLPLVIQGHEPNAQEVVFDLSGVEFEEAEGKGPTSNDRRSAAEPSPSASKEVPVLDITGERTLVVRCLTFVQSPSSAAPVVRVEGSGAHVTFERCVFSAGLGVCCFAQHKCQVKFVDCVFRDSPFAGIRLKGTQHCFLKDCRIERSGRGIFVEGNCGSLRLDTCTVAGCHSGSGVSLESNSTGRCLIVHSSISQCEGHCLNGSYGSAWQVIAEDCSFEEGQLGNVFLGCGCTSTSSLSRCQFGPCPMSSLSIVLEEKPTVGPAGTARRRSSSGVGGVTPSSTSLVAPPTKEQVVPDVWNRLSFPRISSNHFEQWQYFAALFFVGGKSSLEATADGVLDVEGEAQRQTGLQSLCEELLLSNHNDFREGEAYDEVSSATESTPKGRVRVVEASSSPK